MPSDKLILNPNYSESRRIQPDLRVLTNQESGSARRKLPLLKEEPKPAVHKRERFKDNINKDSIDDGCVIDEIL